MVSNKFKKNVISDVFRIVIVFIMNLAYLLLLSNMYDHKGTICLVLPKDFEVFNKMSPTIS